jgi:hypothetical protein
MRQVFRRWVAGEASCTVSANNQHQRCEPAAGDADIATDRTAGSHPLHVVGRRPSRGYFSFQHQFVVLRRSVNSNPRREYLHEPPSLACVLVNLFLIIIACLTSGTQEPLTQADELVLESLFHRPMVSVQRSSHAQQGIMRIWISSRFGVLSKRLLAADESVEFINSIFAAP